MDCNYSYESFVVGKRPFSRLACPSATEIVYLPETQIAAVPISGFTDTLGNPAVRQTRRKAIDRINPSPRKVKLSLKLVEVQLPEIEVIHESFGRGIPFEGADNGNLWVHFADGDRLVTAGGFIGDVQSVLDLFARQIVLRHRTYREFKRKRTIQVAEIVSSQSAIALVKELAADLSEDSSNELIAELRRHPHLEQHAILDWTGAPIVGPCPDTKHYPTASAVTGSKPSDKINSALLFSRYYKGRSAAPVTAKDMAESTFRFSDVEAKRNEALHCDPAFDNATFDSLSIEFYDTDKKLMQDDEVFDVAQLQTRWFAGLSDINKAQEAIRTLERRQLLMKYRREIEVARAQIKIGHWEIAREECRQRCNCSLPKCKCFRPRFVNDTPCICPKPRCECWRTVQRCQCQMNQRRPFGFCAARFVEAKNGTEWAYRADADVHRHCKYTPKQVRLTIDNIESIISTHVHAGLSQYRRPLPADNDGYYRALMLRTMLYYRSSPEIVQRWAKQVDSLDLVTMSGQQQSTAMLDAWKTECLSPVGTGA